MLINLGMHSVYHKVPKFSKFLNFRAPENFAVNYLKFKQRGHTIEHFDQKDANEIANSEDPDQTAPLGVV